MASNNTLPQALDPTTLDLVDYIRSKGFSARDIVIMSMIADIEVTVRSRKDLIAKLESKHGITITSRELRELEMDPKFQDCVNRIFTVEEGHMLRAVRKNLFRRASDPRDPQAIAAAKLIFQLNGELGGKKKAGEGGSGGNTYAEFLDEFRRVHARAQREGRVTYRERSISIEPSSEEEVLEESGSQSGKVVQGNFTCVDSPSGDDPPEADAAVEASGDPED